MKCLLILPYWEQTEVYHFEWILKNWEELTQINSKHTYEFLMVGRFDFNGNTDNLFNLCSTYAPTRRVILPGSKTGHPDGSNEMWWHALDMVKNDGYTCSFWWEYDVIPQNPKWLQICLDAWHDEYLVMGYKVTKEWIVKYWSKYGLGIFIDEHINGAAFYNPRTTNLTNLKMFKDGWDFELPKYFTWDLKQQNCLYGIELFDLILNPARIHDPSPRSLMIHGAKTINQKEAVLASLDCNRMKNECSHCQGRGYIF